MVSDEPGPDILIHVNVLRSFGHSSIGEGAVVELVAQESQRGLQATEILSITPGEPAGHQDRRTESPVRPPGGPEGPLEPARIKWFDKMRGFGFANVFGSPDDVFVHMEILRQCNIADLQAGEAVAVRISQGPRGRMVSEIRPWESVQTRNAGRPDSAGDLPDGDGPE